MEMKDFVLGFAAGKAQGGGGGIQIPDAKLLTPYKTDDATGFVSASQWIGYYGSYEVCRSDFYLLPERSPGYFLVFIAGSGGSRFRVVTTNTDPTTIPVGTQRDINGSLAGARSYGNGAWDNTNFGSWDGKGAFTGALLRIFSSSDKYLLITKTNENVDNIPSYVIDITDVL